MSLPPMKIQDSRLLCLKRMVPSFCFFCNIIFLLKIVCKYISTIKRADNALSARIFVIVSTMIFEFLLNNGNIFEKNNVDFYVSIQSNVFFIWLHTAELWHPGLV